MPEGVWGVVFAAVWVVLLIQSAVVVALCHYMRDLYDRKHAPDAANAGPALESVVPETRVVDVTGKAISVGGRAARKRLLVFLSPGCPSCRRVVDQLAGVSPDVVDVVLLWGSSREKVRRLAAEYGRDGPLRLRMVADERRDLQKQFDISTVPFAVVVDEDGRVAAKSFLHQEEDVAKLLAAGVPSAPVTARDPAREAAAATRS